MLLAWAVCGLAACGEGGSEDDLALTQPELQRGWLLCANEGQVCAFSGTKRVRYRIGSQQYETTFRDGAVCRGSVFGTTQPGQGRCYIQGDRRGYRPGAGQLAAGRGGIPVVPAQAGQLARAANGGSGGSPTAAGSSASDPHAAHSGGAGASGGPFIDTKAIPAGDVGASTVRISPTSEQPVASDGTGAFRTQCTYSHMSFDDPIVFPGQPGKSHLHTFFGNTRTDADSTPITLRSSGNSTCRGGIANRTGYWVPALIDPSGKPVEPEVIDVYYKSGYNGVKPANIHDLPAGLRMIAGNAKSTGPQVHSYWGCRKTYIGKPGAITDCPAGDSVTMVIEFPQCWDGKNLDSADHMSHMAFARNGCPASHPIAIPEITFNVQYSSVSAPTAGYRLASDMYPTSSPGGYSGHGDWFNGWDPLVSKAFVQHCIQPAVDCHSHLLGDGRRIN